MIFEVNINWYNNHSNYKSLLASVNDDKIKICTDTRELQKDHYFLPLKGDSFDGHQFISDVIEKGVKGIIANKDYDFTCAKTNSLNNVHIIKVDDTLDFLQGLARERLETWKQNGGKVISLTGSNGKTTNKEILLRILKGILGDDKVVATSGNFNNHIGVPLTIFSIADHHQVAIIEIGTNHPGEIENLCHLGLPDVGFITNIGDSHLEFFKNKEGVFNEKRALYDYVIQHSQETHKFFKNNYDPFLSQLPSVIGVTDIGPRSENDIETKNNLLKIRYKTKEFEILNKNIREDYNLFNLGFCSLVSCYLFPEKVIQILNIAGKLELPKNNRSCWINKGNKQVFLDAYNANPSSMRAALKSFVSKIQAENKDLDKTLFILGDMNELGELADTLHTEIGKELVNWNVKHVAFIGQYRDFYLKGYAGKDLGARDLESFIEADWKSLIRKYDQIFIKGSRSVRLERLLDTLEL